METTQISPEKTIAEIQELLVQHKATSILMQYEGGKVSSVCFRIEVRGVLVPFVLPCRWKPIQSLLAQRHRDYQYSWKRSELIAKFAEQSRRVAWRQILRWVQAQLALVETGMVKVEEVFLPYVQADNGQTIFEITEAKGLLMLTNQSEALPVEGEKGV